MVGSLDVRSEGAVVGRIVLTFVEWVEGRIVETVDTLTKKEVVGTGRVVGRTLIVGVFDRMVCDSGVEEILWGREAEIV